MPRFQRQETLTVFSRYFSLMCTFRRVWESHTTSELYFIFRKNQSFSSSLPERESVPLQSRTFNRELQCVCAVIGARDDVIETITLNGHLGIRIHVGSPVCRRDGLPVHCHFDRDWFTCAGSGDDVYVLRVVLVGYLRARCAVLCVFRFEIPCAAQVERVELELVGVGNGQILYTRLPLRTVAEIFIAIGTEIRFRRLHAAEIDRDDVARRCGRREIWYWKIETLRALDERKLDLLFRAVIVPFARIVVDDVAIGVDEIVVGPELAAEGVPRAVLVVQNDRVRDAELLHRIGDIRIDMLEGEFRSGNADNNESVGCILFVPGLHIRN